MPKISSGWDQERRGEDTTPYLDKWKLLLAFALNKASGFWKAAQDVHALNSLTAGAFDEVVFSAHNDEASGAKVATIASVSKALTALMCSARTPVSAGVMFHCSIDMWALWPRALIVAVPATGESTGFSKFVVAVDSAVGGGLKVKP